MGTQCHKTFRQGDLLCDPGQMSLLLCASFPP